MKITKNINNKLKVLTPGFVPESDSFSAEICLVPKENIPEILAKGSFSEEEEIIRFNTLLW